MLEVSLLGVGTVLHLERDAWSMVKLLRQATNEYPPPPPSPQTVQRMASGETGVKGGAGLSEAGG